MASRFDPWSSIPMLTYAGQLALLATFVLLLRSVPKLALGMVPHGLPVYVSQRCTSEPHPHDPTILRLLNDGRVSISGSYFEDGQLPGLISRIMETRAERDVYITAENEVPYQRVVTVIGEARHSTADLAIVLAPRFDPKDRYDESCY